MIFPPSFFSKCFLCFLLLTVTATQAQELEWIPTDGPEGADIRSIAFDPEDPAIVYVGTNSGGLFASADSGFEWVPSNEGLVTSEQKYILALAVNPQNPEEIFAATSDGVFKSQSYGESWLNISDNLNLEDVNDIFAVAIDHENPDNIYIGTGTGIFKSTVGGGQWQDINTGLTTSNRFIEGIAIDPEDSQIIYIRDFHRAFKSLDGGATWQEISIGLPSQPGGFDGEALSSIYIDPQESNVLYTLLPNVGVYRSEDAGGSWSSTGSIGLPSAGDTFFNSLAVDAGLPGEPDTLYLSTSTDGVFKSTDGGANWQPVNDGITENRVNVIAINPASDDLYAGGFRKGVFFSADGGTSWELNSFGLLNIQVDVVAIHPEEVDILYAGAFGAGMFRSDDGGDTWLAINNGLTDTFIQALAVNPDFPEVLYAGSVDDGVFKSLDSGENWLATAGVNSEVLDLAIDPLNPDVVYAATADSGIFKSVDAGDNWLAINNGLPAADLEIDGFDLNQQNPNILYAGTAFSGIFISVDAGASWQPSRQGLSLDGTNFPLVREIVVDIDEPDVIYAATKAGVFKSEDAGANWFITGTGLNDIEVFNIAIEELGEVVYAATVEGLFVSTDAGETWEKENIGLPTGNLRGLAISPVSDDVVFVGSEGNSVFRTIPDSFDDIGIADLDFENLTPEDFDSLNSFAFHAFVEDELALLPPEVFANLDTQQFGRFAVDALAGLTTAQVERIPASVFAGIDGDQLAAFDVNIFEVLTEEDVLAFNDLELFRAGDTALARFLTNLNGSLIDPTDIDQFLPPGWSVDSATGEFTVPTGTGLFFEVLDSLDEFDSFADLELPNDIPDINTGFGLGGRSSLTLSEGIGQALTASGLGELSFDQDRSGVLNFTVGDVIYSVLPDGDGVTQGDMQILNAGLTINANNQLVLTTPRGQLLPLIPAPKNPVELQSVLGGKVRVGKDGEVLITQSDGTLLVVLFDPLVLPNSGLGQGLQLLPASQRRAGGPLGQVVFGNGSAQQIFPYIPEPQTFRQTLMALSPLVESVDINLANGTVNARVAGSNFLLTPQSTTKTRDLTARDKVTPTITINPNLTLDFKVKSGTEELLSNMAITPM